VMFNGADFETVGGLVRGVLGDEDARRAILARQANRLKDFSPQRFLTRLAALVEKWLESG
ncbi:MAG: hypothetical protein JSU68_14990, partial [Phycisphaerales bacterium]